MADDQSNSDDKAKKSIAKSRGKSFLTEKVRGTQDDIEVITLILDENPALRQRVLDKIKSIRKLNKI